MRSISKSLAGGVLAAMLVLSASPAQAFGPSSATDGTVQDEPGAGATGSEITGAEATEAEAPGAETPESEAPAGQAPEAESSESVEDETQSSDEPASTEAASSEEAETETGDTSDESAEAPEEAPSGETLTVTPKSLEVTGTLFFVPGEPTPAQEMGLEPLDLEAQEAADLWLLATSEGPALEVDPQNIAGDLSSLSNVEATVTLGATVEALVSEKIADEASVTSTDVLEIIDETTTESGVLPDIVGQVTKSVAAADALVAGAPATKAHSADIAVLGAANNKSNIKSLMTQASAYWNKQSNGKIPSISFNTTSRYKTISGASACNQQGLWNIAAKKFGRSVSSYESGARHLIVFVSSGACNAAGLGSVGTLHSGGTVWVDLKGNTTNKGSLKVLAHEFGHNLSLGHSQARYCTKGVDSKVSLKADEQTALRVYKPNSPCRDIEYGDAWSLMGTGLPGGAPAVSTAQKAALGVLPSGSVRTVSATGGRSQTFKINGAGAASGLRGLKVNTPNGGSFYVEYRNGRGQDAGSRVKPGSDWVNNAGPLHLSTGVQVVKSYPTAQAPVRWSNGATTWQSFKYLRSSTIPFRSGSKLYVTGQKGHTTIPVSSNARVRVVSTTASQATVRIEFSPFVDVPYDRKFAKEINWMSSAKLSTGSDAGKGTRKYLPSDNVSREAMAAFLYRLNTPAGKKAPKGYKIPKVSPFADVKPGDKFYKEIAWMYTSKLSTGTKQASGKPKYLPKQGVTREAMSAFLYRMDKKKKPATLKISPFADMTPKSKFYREISWMYRTGLSTGTKQPSGKPKYLPKSTVTREAMAAFIYRYKH